MVRPRPIDIILRTQLQRRQVHQDKVPTTSRVHRIKRLEYAVRVVCQCRPREVTVGQERAVAEVIGADPESVHRVVRLPVGVDGVGPRLRVGILGLGQERGNLVPHYIREGELAVFVAGVPQGIRVVAECPRDGVVEVLGL